MITTLLRKYTFYIFWSLLYLGIVNESEMVLNLSTQIGLNLTRPGQELDYSDMLNIDQQSTFNTALQVIVFFSTFFIHFKARYELYLHLNYIMLLQSKCLGQWFWLLSWLLYQLYRSSHGTAKKFSPQSRAQVKENFKTSSIIIMQFFYHVKQLIVFLLFKIII